MTLIESVLSALSYFFHEQAILAFGLMVLLAFFLVRRRRVLLLALILSLALTPLIKQYYDIDRPCVGQTDCPTDPGFPSHHATLGFVFAAATWGQPVHLLFLPLGLLMGWSRIYLGVHNFAQVAAGIAVGVWYVHMAQALIAWYDRRKQPRPITSKASHPLGHQFEAGRQVIHILFGLFFVALGLILNKREMLILLMTLLGAGMLVSTLKTMGLRLYLLDRYLLVLERPGMLPGRGVIMYAAGMLLLFAFAPSQLFALGIASILAVGDGLATLVGSQVGGMKLPWNKHKTASGTLAFFAGSFIASVWFLGTSSALFYSALLALVESIDWGLDDNLLIPTAGIIIRELVKI